MKFSMTFNALLHHLSKMWESGRGKKEGKRKKERERKNTKVSKGRNRDEQNFEKHIDFRKKLIQGLYSRKMG